MERRWRSGGSHLRRSTSPIVRSGSWGTWLTADFVDLWAVGDNSFEADPPNAVLSFLRPGDTVPDDVVIAIKEPRLADGDLVYLIDVLDGSMPREAGPVSLFIDPIGRPLSPVSVCGVRRRERRRDRRGM